MAKLRRGFPEKIGKRMNDLIYKCYKATKKQLGDEAYKNSSHTIAITTDIMDRVSLAPSEVTREICLSQE